jgi:hypothetical protein
MLLHIANFYDAPRRTAIAGEAIPLGAVIKLDNAAGERTALVVDDADAAILLPGTYGVAMKVSNQALQVSSSDGVPADFGTRLTAIATGDAIMEIGRGAIIEYDPSLLHASLDAARSGVAPVAGDALGVKDGLFCKADVVSAIISPVIGRVFEVLGNGKVRVELV